MIEAPGLVSGKLDADVRDCSAGESSNGRFTGEHQAGSVKEESAEKPLFARK
jgi:hypothetical protein